MKFNIYIRRSMKEFRETEIFKNADIVTYFNEDGEEIEPTSEVQRRKMFNMEVVKYEGTTENELVNLKVVLRQKRRRENEG